MCYIVLPQTRNKCYSDKPKPRAPAKQNSDIWQDYLVSAAYKSCAPNIGVGITMILRVLLPRSGKGELAAPCSFRLSFDGEQSHRFPVNLQTATASAGLRPRVRLSTQTVGLSLSPLLFLCFCLKTPFQRFFLRTTSKVTTCVSLFILFHIWFSSRRLPPTAANPFFSSIRVPKGMRVWSCSPRL